MELILFTCLGLVPLPTLEQIRDAKIQASINQAHELQHNYYRELMEKNIHSQPINTQQVIKDLRPNSTGRIRIYYDQLFNY